MGNIWKRRTEEDFANQDAAVDRSQASRSLVDIKPVFKFLIDEKLSHSRRIFTEGIEVRPHEDSVRI